MRDWSKEALLLVKNHMYVWMRIPHLKPLAKVIRNDAETVTASVAHILAAGRGNPRERADEARAHVVQYALERAGIEFKTIHFILFKEAETVQVILEDAFGVVVHDEVDLVTPPFQEEVAKMIVRCLFQRRRRPFRTEEIVSFFRMFTGDGNGTEADQDRTMRTKSMVWLAYLLIDLIRTDGEPIVKGGAGYLKTKLKELMDKVLEGSLISEEYASPRFNYEGGRWDDTLFGWLQGEDRRPFVLRLMKQFNLDNKVDHGNRLLLASHRECLYRQAVGLFCRTGA